MVKLTSGEFPEQRGGAADAGNTHGGHTWEMHRNQLWEDLTDAELTHPFGSRCFTLLPGLHSIHRRGEAKDGRFHLLSPWRGRKHMEQPHALRKTRVVIWNHG